MFFDWNDHILGELRSHSPHAKKSVIFDGNLKYNKYIFSPDFLTDKIRRKSRSVRIPQQVAGLYSNIHWKRVFSGLGTSYFGGKFAKNMWISGCNWTLTLDGETVKFWIVVMHFWTLWISCIFSCISCNIMHVYAQQYFYVITCVYRPSWLEHCHRVERPWGFK